MFRSLNRWAIVFIAFLLTPYFGWLTYSVSKGEFYNHLYLGKEFKEKVFHQLTRVGVKAFSQHGYDAQFYAQLSLDPFLLDSDVAQGLDTNSRSQRIGVPLASYLFGMGNPRLILTIYVLINYASIIFLVWLLWQMVPLVDAKAYAIWVAILWGSGVVVSVQRALLDLPSLTLMLGAIFFLQKNGCLISGGLFSYALLTREACLTSIGCLITNEKLKDVHAWIRLAGFLGLIILPSVLWALYARWRLGWDGFGSGAITIQLFQSFGEAWVTKWHQWIATDISFSFFRYTLWERNFWELLAMFSISYQAFFMLVTRKFNSPYWWLAIGGAIYVPIMGFDGFTEQEGFCRILLTLTVGVNLLLMDMKKNFWLHFALANVGMFGLIRMLMSRFI